MLKIRKNGICAASALFVAACILLGTLFAATVRADEEEYFFPTLYCNDEAWYKSDIYPLDRYYQTYYMPVSILERFEGIKISENERFSTLLITSSAAQQSRFISFNLNTDKAVTDKISEFNALIYTKDGEYYVPAEIVCNALGLSADIYRNEKTGETALRICNGTQKKTFAELIEQYGYSDTSDTTDSGPYDTTEPQVTDQPTPADAKTIYFTFDGASDEAFDAILEKLKEHNKKATFFVSYDDMSAHPENIIKITAAGHSIGCLFDVDGYIANPAGAFESQNDVLMRILKFETRFVRLVGTTQYDKAKQEALDAEYTVWGWDIDLTAENDGETKQRLDELEAKLGESDVLVLRMAVNEHSEKTLSAVLDYIDQNINCTAKMINDATHSVD